MFKSLDLLQMAQDRAQHASVRQGVVARNMANADTPGYRAQDVAAFGDVYDGAVEKTDLRTTRTGHLGAADATATALSTHDVDAPVAPNGNSVSIEGEMVRANEAMRKHDMALTVYRSGLDLLRTAIGRG